MLIEKVEEKRRKQKLVVQSDVPMLGYIWQKGLLIGDFDVINTTTGKVAAIGYPCLLKSSEYDKPCSILYCFEFLQNIEKENFLHMLREHNQSDIIYPNLQNPLWNVADDYHWSPSQEHLILDVLKIK